MKTSSALIKRPKKLEGTYAPPTLIIFPKSMDQNFEIMILFNVVKKLINTSLGTTYSPTVPVGGATSYKLWPVLAYSNIYWEVYRRFQGNFLVGRGVEKRGIYWGSYPSKNLSWGKKISMKGVQDFLALLKKMKK